MSAAARAPGPVAFLLSLVEKLRIGHDWAIRMFHAHVCDVAVVVGHTDRKAGGLHRLAPERLRLRAQAHDCAAPAASATYGVSAAVACAALRAFNAAISPNTTIAITTSVNSA